MEKVNEIKDKNIEKEPENKEDQMTEKDENEE
jgi:hypothetical protein